MFDCCGRIMCAECASSMAAVEYTKHTVTFCCENALCDHRITFRLAPRPGPAGLQDDREAAAA